MKNLVGVVHEDLVAGRRVRVLARHLADLVPHHASVLDVGCGDGAIDGVIQQKRPDVTVRGVDVLARENTKIPVDKFDGVRLPFADSSFDVVMFVDVLHHTDDPMILLSEARRVSRRFILLKDHTRDGLFAGTTLRLMDWVGNAHHGVALPYNYWQEREWKTALATLRLKLDTWKSRLGLYPWPGSLLFERGLHFIARLERPAS